MKCDETRPVCTRCMRDAWACDYAPKKYIPPTISARDGSKPPRQKGTPLPTYDVRDENSITLLRSCFNNFAGTFKEHRFMDFFISKTAADLGLFAENTLWSIDICRIAFTEKPVQHAVIAVAALHEDHLRELELQHPMNQSFSLSQYNKAIRTLNKRLSNDETSYRITLVTCLLFVYLEFLQGSPENALSHLHSGLKLLPHYRRYVRDYLSHLG